MELVDNKADPLMEQKVDLVAVVGVMMAEQVGVDTLVGEVGDSTQLLAAAAAGPTTRGQARSPLPG